MNAKKSLFITLALIIVILSGCAKTANTTEVKKYSDSIVEEMLIGILAEDHTNYAKHFDSKFKSDLTDSKINDTAKIIKNKIGSYVPNSKKIEKAYVESEKGKKYIIAIYSAKFTDEPKSVTVTIIYLDNNSHPVESFTLNSPKLAKGN